MGEKFKRPDKSELPLYMALGCAGHLCFIYENMLLEKYGITSKQSKVLLFLIVNSDKEINGRTLEKEFKLTAATITSIIGNLEKAGFIERVVGNDARNKYISVAEKGLEIKKKILLTSKKTSEVAFSELTDDEAKELRRLCDKVIINMHSALEEKKNEKME